MAPGGDVPGRVMAAEMAEQPEHLARLLGRADEIGATLRSVAPAEWQASVVVARGSSDHAGNCGRYLLEMATRRPVSMASPSLLTHYKVAMDYRGCLVIAVSQSGRTPEIVETLLTAQRHGGRTLAVTNDPHSELAGAAQATICLEVGEEKAIPATKTVTAQLAVFALLAQAVADVGFSPAGRGLLPAEVERLLADDGPVEETADWLAGADRMLTVARGILGGAAAETALKLAETSSILATSFSAADLRHGPVAVTGAGLPVLGFAHPGPTAADLVDVLRVVSDRGARVRLAGALPEAALHWSARLPEAAAPIAAVVRGQQLALCVARRLGRDPDRPAGLEKVTAT